MSKIRTNQIKASILYKKNCGIIFTAVISLLGMMLLLYGFSLTLSGSTVNSAPISSLLGLPIATSSSHASFFAIAGSALLGGAIAIIGIVKQRQTARSKNTIDFEAALEDSNSYNSSYAKVQKIVAKKDNYPVMKWAGEDKVNSDNAIAIKTVLNYWERASNGVRKDVYDSDFLYDIYGTHVLNLHEYLLPFIEEVREKRQSKAFENFLALTENWLVKRQSEQERADRKKAKKDKCETQEAATQEAKTQEAKTQEAITAKSEQSRVETRQLK